jgi:dihydropyrimidinase
MFGLYPRKGTLAPGADADVVIYDPHAEYTVSARDHHMNVDYSAYEGRRLAGRVETVLSRGVPVIDHREYVGRAGHGRYTPRGTCSYLD